MAELIEDNEIMFTNFEPKTQNRYIMYLQGIPSYLIKTSGRPSFSFETIEMDHINVKRKLSGKPSWDPLEITLYDPINPSGAQAVMEWVRLQYEPVTGRMGYSDMYKKDITINVLGPVGDKVEEWTLKGAHIETPDFGTLDWSASDPVEISLSLQYNYAILQY